RSLPMWNGEVKRRVCPVGKRTTSGMPVATEGPRDLLWNLRPHGDGLRGSCSRAGVVGDDHLTGTDGRFTVTSEGSCGKQRGEQRDDEEELPHNYLVRLRPATGVTFACRPLV